MHYFISSSKFLCKICVVHINKCRFVYKVNFKNLFIKLATYIHVVNFKMDKSTSDYIENVWFLPVSTSAWSRPGALALHPLQHSEGALLPGVITSPGSHDHRIIGTLTYPGTLEL